MILRLHEDAGEYLANTPYLVGEDIPASVANRFVLDGKGYIVTRDAGPRPQNRELPGFPENRG